MGDLVWIDANADGLQTPGEAGLAGVTVNLYDSSNRIIATTTTNGTGFYLFDNVAPEPYTIGFVLPGGYSFAPPDSGADDSLDSDADPLSGRTATIVLAPGTTNGTIDAGVYQPANLGDFVWLDRDGDGIQDAGESGMGDITVRLYDRSNTLVGTTTTIVAGFYLFDGLRPGDYLVEVVPPPTYRITLQHRGTNDALDSNIDPSAGRSALILLCSGGTNLTIDAGLYQNAAIGHLVWHDEDGDGVQEPGEGFPGVTVTLYSSSNAVIATTTTSVTGEYTFETPPGTYMVEFKAPTGQIFSPPHNSPNEEVVATPIPKTVAAR